MLAFFLYLLLFVTLGERIRYLYSLDWREREIGVALSRFPPPVKTVAEIQKGKEYLKHLETLNWQYPGDYRAGFEDYKQHIRDTIVIWKNLDFIQTYGNNLEDKYVCLQWIKESIGEENYLLARLPLPYDRKRFMSTSEITNFAKSIVNRIY